MQLTAVGESSLGKPQREAKSLRNNTYLSVDREKEKAVSLLDKFH